MADAKSVSAISGIYRRFWPEEAKAAEGDAFGVEGRVKLSRSTKGRSLVVDKADGVQKNERLLSADLERDCLYIVTDVFEEKADLKPQYPASLVNDIGDTVGPGDKVGKAVVDVLAADKVDWNVKLVVLLMWAIRGGDSRLQQLWSAYKEAGFLPDLDAMPCLLNFTDEESCAALQDPSLEAEAKELVVNIDTWHEHYFAEGKDLHPLCPTSRDLRWALSIIRTRSMTLPVMAEGRRHRKPIPNLSDDEAQKLADEEDEYICGYVKALVPFVDMVNHAAPSPIKDLPISNAHITLEPSESGGRCMVHLTAESRLKAGKEVTFTYFSDGDNADLLRTFGFIEPGNPNEAIGFTGLDANCIEMLALLFDTRVTQEEEGDVIAEGAVGEDGQPLAAPAATEKADAPPPPPVDDGPLDPAEVAEQKRQLVFVLPRQPQKYITYFKIEGKTYARYMSPWEATKPGLVDNGSHYNEGLALQMAQRNVEAADVILHELYVMRDNFPTTVEQDIREIITGYETMALTTKVATELRADRKRLLATASKIIEDHRELCKNVVTCGGRKSGAVGPNSLRMPAGRRLDFKELQKCDFDAEAEKTGWTSKVLGDQLRLWGVEVPTKRSDIVAKLWEACRQQKKKLASAKAKEKKKAKKNMLGHEIPGIAH